jgi:LAGLIDADG endonuclease
MVSTNELYWAAGFLEGEGCFVITKTGRPGTDKKRYSMQVSAAQVQREPLERLEKYFGGKLYACRHKDAKANWSPYWYWYTGSERAIGIMMTLYKLLSPKRQESIRAVLATWKTRPRYSSQRTHCPLGHEYTPENTKVDRRIKQNTSARICRTCLRTKWRKRYQRRHPAAGGGK